MTTSTGSTGSTGSAGHARSTGLRRRLGALTLRDEHRLGRALDRARDPAARARVEEGIATAEARVERRRAAVPAVTYPEVLPVSRRRGDLLAAIRDHQVVVVAGETGSGKTTQLPKICLELGRGVRGLIGHTQPRRIAARTVAERIAEELHVPLGGAVGYAVRFTDQVGDNTVVKLMTDGILLAEIQHDPLLRGYDTIILDEAHERSLNIDFLLGYLRRLLPRRPDLKIVITSATIDPQRFADHFAEVAGEVPVVEVSGRTYPVEIRYRPRLADGGPDEPGATARDQTQAVCDAVAELCAEGAGDVLVFLSGEREIRDTADALTGLTERGGAPVEVLPLYARLSAAEQHRVFERHRGRRVVLATNVAETSLTVPGVRYVVDPGTARISRYSRRTKVQRLPIEPISQASARQRSGRCGRTSAGICIRLYAEDDYETRPAFTDPEILRTSLASVILQMAALGLGEVAAFPFVDPPDRRAVTDGLDLLRELGALEKTSPGTPRRRGERDGPRLTPLGRRLARLPIDVRLARMVLAAESAGCVHEVLVITAALSIQDPRERPADAQQQADEKHARFAEKTSDFLAYLNLWAYLAEQQDERSSSAFRRLCRAEFLHYLRVREWQDLYGQLRQIVRSLGIDVADKGAPPADPRQVHTAVLAGLLSQLGFREGDARDFAGARGARFAIWPGSGLARRPPRWVMAAELVETSRLWGRVAAQIEPTWVEPLAEHLTLRIYSDPRWDAEQGAVLATERVTLFGLPLVVGRAVNYGRIDPPLARELFIRHALVEGDWSTHHPFFHENQRLLERAEELEHRARRRDIVVDDDTLFDFYDARVGPDVVSGRHFDGWWKKVRREQPDLLRFTPSMLVARPDAAVPEQYPDRWRVGDDIELPLSYRFEPGSADDGVTVDVPLEVLNRVRAEELAWQVPGLRHDLVTALLRGLPKEVRRSLGPAPDLARAALADVDPDAGDLLPALERAIARRTGVTVPREAWQWSKVPAHLRPTFRVLDDRGRELGEDKDLETLRVALRGRAREALAVAAGDVERTGLRTWPVDGLPRVVSGTRAGVRGYPALADEGSSVAVRVFADENEQRVAMRGGVRRLLLLALPSPATALRGLSNASKLALSAAPHGSVAVLLADCTAAAVDAVVADAGGLPWDEASFAALVARARSALPALLAAVVGDVERVLVARRDALAAVADLPAAPVLAAAVADMRAQVDGLVHAGFVTATGVARLRDVVRYLRGVARRCEALRRDPARDRVRMDRVAGMWHAYERLVGVGGPDPDAVEEIRWLVEELRVSLFAQVLGTRVPVSEERIQRAIDALA